MKMKYENKEAFEKANIFGTGAANTAYARFFIGDSFLNPLSRARRAGFFAATYLRARLPQQLALFITQTSGGGQLLIAPPEEGMYQEEGKAPVTFTRAA